MVVEGGSVVLVLVGPKRVPRYREPNTTAAMMATPAATFTKRSESGELMAGEHILLSAVYILSDNQVICSSHCEVGPDGSAGALHGHNWKIVAHVEASELDGFGRVLGRGTLSEVLWDVVEPLDHRHLNDLPLFSGELKPSPPAIARWVGEQLAARLDDGRVRVRSVDVWVSADRRASWEQPRGAG